jgi:primosomal protein N''
MNNILPHLDTSMQEIYRKAVDADAKIVELKKQGMAKFSSVFPSDTLFSNSGNAFIPYVSELSNDIELFKQDIENETKLATILKKMELLLKLLGTFKNITKSA